MSMSSGDEDGDAVVKALAIMYSATHNEQQRQQAMHWLESFQNSQAAWNVAMHFLQAPTIVDSNVIFFAAQTMKHKVQVDLLQLDGTGQEQLYHVLHNLAYKSDLAKPVRTQILLALAAFLVQTKTPLVAGADERVYVELLAMLPEQLNNNKSIHLSDEMHAERKLSLLVAHSATAISLFLKALSVPHFQQVAVDGLENWIHYADLTSEQAIHILQVAVMLITKHDDDHHHDGVVEGGCEIVCELVYQNTHNDHFYGAFCHYLPHLCNLLTPPPSSTVDADDDEGADTTHCKAVGSMVMECSELLLARFIRETPSIFDSLIPAALSLAKSRDQSVVEVTFNFWTELQALLESTDDASVRDAFIPVYLDLFKSLLPPLQYPSDQVIVTAEEKESFRDFRHVIGDVLKECVRVSGSTSVVELLMAAVENHLTRHDIDTQWQPMEAILFALRTIASVIDRRESERLPALFPLLLSLRSHPRLVYSCLLVIGCLSDWLRYHQDQLPGAIDYIVLGLTNTVDGEVTSAAAMAMRYLAESCGDVLSGKYAHQLLSLYDRVLSQPDLLLLDEEDQLSVSESICHVIVADPQQISSLLPSAIKRFTDVLKTADGHHQDGGVNMALKHISLFVELVVPDSISIISSDFCMTSLYLRDVEPLLIDIAIQFGESVSEGLSMVFKAAIGRYSRSLGQSWLGQVVSKCQLLYGKGRFPLAVYTLRYAVLLGDCDKNVQRLMTKDLLDHFALYSQRPLDCLNLVTSMYDYWRTIDDAVVPPLIHMVSMIVSDASQGAAEVSAALIVALRIAMHTPGITGTPAYTALLTTTLHHALLHMPLQVLSDMATLLHRYSRLSSSEHISSLFDAVYAGMPAVVGREREAWRGQVLEALAQPRPKAIRAVLVAQSNAIRRRL